MPLGGATIRPDADRSTRPHRREATDKSGSGEGSAEWASRAGTAAPAAGGPYGRCCRRWRSRLLEQLKAAGLLVKPRFSQRTPGEITGYAVALPGDRTHDGQPVWFGGGKLTADLSWAKLARRWSGETENQTSTGRMQGVSRASAWMRAASTASRAADTLRQLASHDPAAASDIAHATADALNVTARTVEGRKGGPLTDAATAYDRASRELLERTPPHTIAGDRVRAAARLRSLTGRAHRNEVAQFLHLLTQLLALTDAVAHLRAVQGRAVQAAAARQAAGHLRTIAPARDDGLPLPGHRALVLNERGAPTARTAR